jgi:hypothetical protein
MIMVQARYQFTVLPAISIRAQCHLNSPCAIMLHIRHIFLYPSLSDSDLPFGNLLYAQIPALFRRIAEELRAKIASRPIESKI